MILPLPVKKNKFGENVADISIEKYYRQVAEEVVEAYRAAIFASIIKTLRDDGCGQCVEFLLNTNEAEELVDIITCCITRLEILGYNAEMRQKLYHTVNEKNRKRGYFDD